MLGFQIPMSSWPVCGRGDVVKWWTNDNPLLSPVKCARDACLRKDSVNVYSWYIAERTTQF